jgi:hypothetical protein
MQVAKGCSQIALLMGCDVLPLEKQHLVFNQSLMQMGLLLTIQSLSQVDISHQGADRWSEFLNMHGT